MGMTTQYIYRCPHTVAGTIPRYEAGTFNSDCTTARICITDPTALPFGVGGENNDAGVVAK